MTRLLFKWLVTTLTILMVPHLVSGVQVDSFGAALAAAALLGVLNVVVRPILILFTLPLTLLTLGFFLFILNAFIFKWVGALVAGFHVDSFGAAFMASIVVSLVSWIMDMNFEKKNGRRVVSVYRTREVGSRGQGDSIDLHETRAGKWEP